MRLQTFHCGGVFFGCCSVPSEGWETTQQDVGDDSSCPDVHLKAIPAGIQRNTVFLEQNRSKFQEESKIFVP